MPTPPRILVCEDDANVRQLCDHVLGSAGYRVTLADSGEAARFEEVRVEEGLPCGYSH